MRALVLVAAAGCWTGGETTAASTTVAGTPEIVQPRPLMVEVQRTACDGHCPVYALQIHGDGRVVWNGRENVAALGERRGRVTARQLAELDRRIDRVRFFERDGYGHLPIEPQCTTVNGTTTCEMSGAFSFCTDTSHTIITVKRRSDAHRIDLAHCSSDENELEPLEAYIEQIANVREWVGADRR